LINLFFVICCDCCANARANRAPDYRTVSTADFVAKYSTSSTTYASTNSCIECGAIGICF
jgi:hypothetical protein